MTTRRRLAALAGLVGRSTRLGPRDGLTCLVAWALLHLAALRLRVSRRVPALRPRPDTWSLPGGEGVAPSAARLEALLCEAARFPAMGLWCLPRAVALRQLLRLHGLKGELALGLRGGQGGLAGHAWVVYHGVVLLHDPAEGGPYVRCEVA